MIMTIDKLKNYNDKKLLTYLQMNGFAIEE